MTQLYMGSEGTLGIITELTLRLHPVPPVRCGAFVSFPDIAAAATCTVRMLRAQLATLVRCECLNADAIRATNKKFGTTLQDVPTLFLEFQASSAQQAMGDAAAAGAVAKEVGCTAWSVASDGASLDQLWEVWTEV